MHPGKLPVNCIPCAKRKVRCDKRQPCCHCKRRKGDVCAYPFQRVNRPDDASGDDTQRIEVLEAYVRRLGGDLRTLGQGGEESELSFDTLSTKSGSRTTATPIGSDDKQSSPQSKNQAVVERMGLVEHNKQVTYIESPMWYSWSGVRQPEDEQVSSHKENSRTTRSRTENKAPHGVPALLDPAYIPNSDSLLEAYPPEIEITALWSQYLNNVHPLIMIFFDWETDEIIHRASKGPSELSPGEQALVFAICFIATLSMSEEKCIDTLHEKQPQVLNRLQEAVERSLMIAELVVTSDRLVLQAFMLYLLAMHSRARPAASFSLLGIATRIAERMGLHRDGDDLGVSVLRSEERRRMWWQLQHMELSIASLTGSITMTIYADWNTKLPANLEDQDLRTDTQVLPPDRYGLTNMSHCLWRYRILDIQRNSRQHDGTRKDLHWMLSPHVPLIEKDAMIDLTEKILGGRFLQHCEPLNPLHVHMQIGVRSFILAARRVARQPGLINTKISEMSRHERENYLGLCTKGLEYYLLLEKNEALKGFQWHSDNYLQWPSLVYIILEAHSRFDENAVVDLWSLLGRVFTGHPKLMTAIHHPDIVSIVRMTLVAWHRHLTYLRQQRHSVQVVESPLWIQELHRNFDLPENPAQAPGPMAAMDASQLLPPDFDFDSIDWSVWGDPNLDIALYETDWSTL